MPVLPSYRNQSIDLRSKSIDWFLYEGNTGILPMMKIKDRQSNLEVEDNVTIYIYIYKKSIFCQGQTNPFLDR